MLERKGPSNMAVINLQDGKPRLGICTIFEGIQKLRGQYFGSFLTTYLTIVNYLIKQLKIHRKMNFKHYILMQQI